MAGASVKSKFLPVNDYDPSELIAVCESILKDGELSGEGLYTLAEWLNEHEEACHQWPGDLLVKPLQEVWADARVTKTELRQMGRLLLRIRKDWAKSQVEGAFERAGDLVVEVLPTFDLSYAQLPLIAASVRIKSQTEKGVFYEVDFSGPSCTCPDWRSQRHSLPFGHLSRCCKHVVDAYGQIEPQDGWPGWLQAFFDQASPPHPKQNWMVLNVGRSLVLASTAPAGWANVFVKYGGVYDRFGFNVLEDRWAYGLEPPGSDQICKAIIEATDG